MNLISFDKAQKMKTRIVILITLLVPLSLFAIQDVEEAPADPTVTSIFPQGANSGTHVEAEVRGESLEGAHAVWFDQEGLQARVQRIEEINLAPEKGSRKTPKKRLGQRVLLEIEVSENAEIGPHSLRLVSRRGVSNALTFWIQADPVLRESQKPHNKPDQAQPVSVPAVIQGRISQDGELDYYELQVAEGQQFTFEVIPTPGLDARLALYELTGSWFDPHRAREVAFTAYDKELGVQSNRLTHRFSKKGRYLVQVGSRFSVGGPDILYQLRVSPEGKTTLAQKKSADPDWQERVFTRKIVPDWLQVLRSRTVPVPVGESDTGKEVASDQEAGVARSTEEPEKHSSLPATPAVVPEEEPNETTLQALEVTLPVVIEGVIERPGDVDHFKFQVKLGERLAFEIETPDSAPPRFQPRMGILDGDGNEFLTNIYRRLGRQFQFYLKTVQSKTVYTFEREGECSLQIRDATSSYGDPSFAYRVLIRRQIPHIGELEVQEDRINLARGEAKKLTVTTGQEEGFGGEILLAVENLPPGVEAFPGTEVEPDRGINPDEGAKERFLAKNQKATIVLMASADAALTSFPRFLSLKARPVVNGKPGAPIPVAEIPLMVVGKAGAHGGAP